VGVPPSLGAMHALLVQVCPLGHVPQFRVPPHPSESDPQVAPCAEHVVGVQVHTGAGLAVGVGQSL